MTLQKSKPLRSKKYLKLVASLPCCVCGELGTVIAHHVRTANNSGMGTKPSDTLTIPLCHNHHMELHQKGREHWNSQYKSENQLLQLTKQKIERQRQYAIY